MDDIAAVLGLDFAEQIEFFRRKIKLPTKKWDDLLGAAHDRAFTVAGALKADLLADLYKAVEPLERISIEQFRKDFRDIVARRGWTGWTGEGTKSGEAWRTKVIYETNVRTSYAAGRYQQLTDPDTLAAMPYWRYVHDDNVMHPRPHHLAWHGTTLRHDHPFWRTHYPPNGWGCRCSVVALAAPQPGDKTSPPSGWDTVLAETGAPVGVDKGWGYAPGASVADELRNMVRSKADKLPPALGDALENDLRKMRRR